MLKQKQTSSQRGIAAVKVLQRGEADNQRCPIHQGKFYRYTEDGRTCRVLGPQMRSDGSWSGRVLVTFVGEPGHRAVAVQFIASLEEGGRSVA